MLNSIRSSATTRKIPTPIATASTMVALGMEGTCWARTCRSGSDMVMIKPKIKLTGTMIHSLLVRVMAAPTFSPIGDMLVSAPRVKNIRPSTIITAPIKKHSRMLGEMGATEKQRIITMQTMGRTAWRDSVNFSFSFTRVAFKSISYLSNRDFHI